MHVNKLLSKKIHDFYEDERTNIMVFWVVTRCNLVLGGSKCLWKTFTQTSEIIRLHK